VYRHWCLPLCALLFLPATAPAEAPAEFIPIVPHTAADGLDGDAIYRRMLENRFATYVQKLTLVSGDAAGSSHEVQIALRYKSDRDAGANVISRTLAKYSAPQDVRHLGYLVINKRDGPDDQFIYRPSTRRVRRINVRGEAVAGTDFAFEDIVPPEFEDGRHIRMPDDSVGKIETWVVTVVPRPESDSQYAKLELYVEKTHAVPLRTLYWDNQRVAIKELRANAASITRYETANPAAPIWIARESRMQHLRLGTFSELRIRELDAQPDLKERDFSERELTASR
jgi:hypothetical protein